MKRVFVLASLAVILGAAALAQKAVVKSADCPGCDKCPLCPDGCCPGK